MEIDPILRNVHLMKAQLAKDAHHDLHALCKQLREAEKGYADRLVFPPTKGRLKRTHGR